MSRVTTHQRWALGQLARKVRAQTANDHEGWVLGKDVGAPAAMEHLARKGYVERKIETGPRGGEHKLYRPSLNGWALVNRAGL